MKMTTRPLLKAMPDVLLLESETYDDHRGEFLESYRESDLLDLIGVSQFVQGNVSVSHEGALRGMHYQVVAPQGKFMRTVHGCTMNAVIDMRDGSATFGTAAWTHLDRPNLALWVPPGFANGFLALEDDTVVVYECSTYYQVGSDRGVLATEMNEANTLRIPWVERKHSRYIMSGKDLQLPRLQDAERVPESEWKVTR